jgi:hypothetical protein
VRLQFHFESFIAKKMKLNWKCDLVALTEQLVASLLDRFPQFGFGHDLAVQLGNLWFLIEVDQ